VLGVLNTVLPSHWGGQAGVDLFTAKSHCLEVLETLGVRPDSLRTTMPAGTGYHHGRSGLLMVGNKCVGAFGDVHPALLATWGLKDPLVAFEVFVENLPPPRTLFPRSSLSLSSYQPVPLDVAFIVDEKVLADDLVRTLKRAAGRELQSLTIFDVFCDDTKIGVQKKSVAFRLVFQSHTHTLDDAFMAEKLQEITHACATQWGAQLRDGAGV
jgi:phenylalanyl-tRNA synthetase beta chain